MKAFFALYNAVLEAIYLLCYPFVYVLTGIKHYRGAMQAHGISCHKGILIHAASMGEVNAIKPLVLRLLQDYPELMISITTNTLTGLNQAANISLRVNAQLACFDVYHLRKKQLSSIDPSLICIVETEIWPNLLAWAANNKIPVMFLNARMSQLSLSRYLRIKSIFRLLEKSIVGILAQSGEDANRFARLFSVPVTDAGNIKFALQLPDYEPEQIRQEWGFTEQDFILTWGSSRPREEALLLSLLPLLRSRIPSLKLIIAIRHPQRLAEVQALLNDSDYRLFSQQKQSSRAEEITVIDVMGVLDKAYSICDLAIVGGSLFDFGAHNPLEPAYYAKAIIIGSYHQSCKESVKRLQQGEAIIVSDADKLEQDILRLAADAELRHKMGTNAKKVLTLNSSALENHLEAIRQTWEQAR